MTITEHQNQALQLASNKWMQIFGGGPYTGLKMLEFLMVQNGKTPTDFLRDPKGSIKGTTRDRLSRATIRDLERTWRYRTGRCTSLAVKAAHELAQHKVQVDGKMENHFDWRYYDLGRHRIARCFKQFVVIDSSSTVSGGAFILPEGQWQTFDKTNASWKFKSSESKFERNGKPTTGDVKTSAGEILDNAAMLQCLKEIEESAMKSVPTLFRSMGQNRVPMFHGIIIWCPKKRAIEMGANTTDWRANKKMTIQWATQMLDSKNNPTKELNTSMVGTDTDLRKCIDEMAQFIHAYGGPNGNGESQWGADGIDIFSIQLFDAACHLWGRPKFHNGMQ